MKKYGYKSTLGSVMALERSSELSKRQLQKLLADRKYLKRTYGRGA